MRRQLTRLILTDGWNCSKRAFAAEIGDDRRFVPYLQLHEFEALLFVDVDRLLIEFPSSGAAVAKLRESVWDFSSPELIDDGSETAPSKRIISAIPDYKGRKVSAGPRIAGEIGLARIREKCRHFGTWLSRLEGLSAGG